MTRRRRISIALGLGILLAIALLSRCREGSPSSTGTPLRTNLPALGRAGEDMRVDPSSLPAWFLRRWGKPSEIAGTVFLDTRPAADVLVTLRSTMTLAGIAPERSVRSGNNGRFSFGVLPPARYTVAASAPDRIAARLDVDLGSTLAEPRPDRLELYLGRCEAVVHGFVRDASGGVVQRASVGTVLIGQFAARESETDEHGEYRLCVPRGLQGISVSAAGYGVVERVIGLVGSYRLDFALSPAAIVGGTVVDAAGAPVERAAIHLIGRKDEIERLGNMITASDAQGRFSLEVAPGHGTLLALSGDSSSQRLAVELTPGESVQGLVLRLQPRATIRGGVRMHGKPAPGIALQLSSDAGVAETVSDADGNFTVASGPTGAVRVSSPTHRVVSGQDLVVPAEGLDHVAIDVAPLARITGRVEKLGAPAVAARITLRGLGAGQDAISDLRGVFRFNGLAAGTYQLEITEDGAQTRAPTMSIELADSEDKDVGAIQLTIAGRITGRVIDDRGEPVDRALVSAVSAAGDSDTALSDEIGAFTIDGIGLGSFALTVRLRGSVLDRIGDQAPLELTQVRPEIHDLTIRVRVQRARIAGRVVDAGGQPLSDVSVQLRTEGDQRSWAFVAASAVTGLDGRFRAEDLAHGSYAIRATQRGGGSVVVTGVAAPRDDVEVVFAAEGEMEGRLEEFIGPVEVLVHSAVDHRSRRALVEGERFRIRGLVAGEYLVMARSGTAIATSVVPIAPPEIARPVLRAQASRRVAGLVRDLSSKSTASGMLCAAAPRATPSARLWYARGPTGADGRFEIAAPAGELFLSCDGGATLVAAVGVASGATAELWTIRRTNSAAAATGVILADDPLVPRVTSVVENTAAQRAGVKPGDVIVAIGEQMLEGIGTAVAVELWLQRTALAPTALTVLRGNKLVTLQPPRP